MIYLVLLFISVAVPPFFHVRPKNEWKVENDFVEIQCAAGGRPQPTIMWTYNGQSIHETEYNPRRIVTENYIKIANVTKIDIGNYACNATNIIGYAFQDIHVQVYGAYSLISLRCKDCRLNVT